MNDTTIDLTAADDAAMQALSDAGAICGECGDEPGDRNCPDCESCYRNYVAALRKAGWATRDEALTEAAEKLRNLRAKYPIDDPEAWKRRHGCGLTDAVLLVEALIRAAKDGETTSTEAVAA